MPQDPFLKLFASVVEVVQRLYPGGLPRVLKIKLLDGKTIQLPIPLEALATAANQGRTTTEK